MFQSSKSLRMFQKKVMELFIRSSTQSDISTDEAPATDEIPATDKARVDEMRVDLAAQSFKDESGLGGTSKHVHAEWASLLVYSYVGYEQHSFFSIVVH